MTDRTAHPPVLAGREELIHTICPHIKQWCDDTDGVNVTCDKCPATVQTSQGDGVQMCRLNAEKAADAILSLIPSPSNARAVEDGEYFVDGDNFRVIYRPGGGSFAGNDLIVCSTATGPHPLGRASLICRALVATSPPQQGDDKPDGGAREALARKIGAGNGLFLVVPGQGDMRLEVKEEALIITALRAPDTPAQLGVQCASEPVAWRILCTNNGATGYLYTEQLPFNPGPGVHVRREPEPLFASLSSAEGGSHG